MRRCRVVVLLASAAALATACNALTGADDLAADLCTDCDDAGVDAAETSVTPPPESKDTGVEAASKYPTFCLGLVLYATYDKDLSSTVGIALSSTKDQVVDGGKFGGGLQAVGTTSSAFYSIDGDAGVYPAAAGTIAFWFKSGLQFGAVADKIFVKPVVPDMSATVNETGPQIRYESSTSTLGITNQNPDGGYVTAGLTSTLGALPGGWNATEYNHLVGSWNQAKNSLQFWLNGGTSASTYAVSTVQWVPQASPTGFVRLSSAVSPTDGTFDDLAMWGRELGPNEVAALYMSPVSIAEACGL